MKRFMEIYPPEGENNLSVLNENRPSKDYLIEVINNDKFKIESDEYMELCDLVNNIKEKIEKNK